jgi:hypothetical protein
VNIDDEILDHVHESIYLQPIYYQLIQDKLIKQIYVNIKKEKKKIYRHDEYCNHLETNIV